MNLKQIIFCFTNLLFQVYAFQLSSDEEKDVPVFQPFPSLIIDTKKLCQGGLSNSIQPFSSQNKQYLAMSLTLCGLYIYDITDLNNTVLVFNDILNPLGKTLGLTYSKEREFLWIGHSTGEFYGINTAKFPFSITARGVSNKNLPVNKVIPWPVNGNVVFLMCYQQFQIFDFRDITLGLLYLQGITVNGLNTYQIEFVRSYTFALVTTANQGIQFYLVNNGQDIDSITFTYTCVLKPYFFDVNKFQLKDENTIAIMMLYKDNGGKTCTPTSFTPLAQTPTQGLGGQMYISQNKRYLYTQFRSVGVRLYDLNKNTFQILQNIKIDSNCNDIILNSDENLLFYTNSLTLQVFKKTNPNFNRDKPNLLLNTYQQVQYQYFKEDLTLGSLDYECSLKEDKQQLYIARANFGAAVFKYSGSGILEDYSYIYRTPSLYPTSKIAFLADGNTAYLARANLGLFIIDFTNPAAPVKVKENITLKSPYVNFNYLQFFKNFQLGIVCNYINGYIISLADPLNPQIIAVIDTMKYTLGETSFYRFILTKDEKHIFMILFTYGILSGDITNPLQPQITSKFFTDGCFDIKLTQDEQYAIIAAAYQGIIIAKVQSDFSLVKVSEVKIVGSMFNVITMQNDQYLLVTTNENPSINLVSIVDIMNPIVIQRIGQESAFGYYCMCLSQDKSSVFITSQFSLLLLQLQNQIILHSQVYELISQENSNEYSRKDLQKGTSLKIGQKIEMHLVPIYQTQNILVRKAYYYEGYVLQELPSWMIFSPSEQILRLNISKDSLQKNDQGQYIDTVQQVVFTTYQSVQTSAFVNTYLGITAADSSALKKACIKEGYMDNLGFIQETYTPSKEINFGVNESTYLAKWIGPQLNTVKQFIQYTLNQNIINYTTNFNIAQSIEVNLKKKEEHIFSLQNDIIIQMRVLEKLQDGSTLQTDKAKFVKKNYSGVLMLLSEKQDEIKLEGSLKNVNSILSIGVKFSINEELIKPQNILIQITVQDGVNYNYENTVPFKDLIFLSMQAPIIISESLNLQKDLQSKYPGGAIFIQEGFQYQISSDVFTSKDESSLMYTAKLKKDDNYVEIPKDYWMQFSSTDRVFTGTPPPSFYNDHVYIQVNATDGYTFTTGQFTVIPNRIPFNYAFQLAIQIFGPIFGVLGFYKYKHFIYNILFKKQYVYSKDVAYVGEVYRKQITITDNNREVAVSLWKFFYNRIGDVQIMHQLSTELMRPNQVTSFQFYGPDLKKQDEEDGGLSYPTFEEEVIRKMYPFGVNEEEMGIVEKKFKQILIESSSKLDVFKSQNNNNNYSLNISKNDDLKNVDGSPTNRKPQRTKIEDSSSNVYRLDVFSQVKQKAAIKRKSTVKKVNTKKIADNIKYGLNICDNISRLKHLDGNFSKKKNRRSIENLQLFIDGKFNFVGILKYIKEEQQILSEKQRIANKNELKQLDNPTSVLSQAICCLLVDHLLIQDRVTKNLFDFMHQKACKYYEEIDWYKAYVNIKHQFEDIHTNPYPQITINEATFKTALFEIFRSISKYYYDPITKNPKPINFSQTLLEEAIKSRAIGITLKSLPILQVTQGESLHTFSHLIHSVKAFEKNSDIPCCFTIHKILDMHYIEKGLTDNEKLPSWIHSIDMINGSILLSGIPEKKDIGSIIFKVIDEQKFILRSYQVQVLQKETENLLVKKPVVFQQSEGKQNEQLHQNIVSALSNSPQTLQVNQSIRKKKVSVFAPQVNDLSQSEANLMNQMGVSNQNIPLTDRLNNTVTNNLMQDISLPLFSPNNNQKLIDINDQTIDVQDDKQIEMMITSRLQYCQEDEKQLFKGSGKVENQKNNQIEFNDSPHNFIHLSDNKNNSSPDNQYQINQKNNIFQGDNNQKQDITDSFIRPSRIQQYPQDQPNQQDNSPTNQSQFEDDRNRIAKANQDKNNNNHKLDQIQEIQNSVKHTQNEDLTDSKLRMFQYS